jgi:uncharacterized membrane protein YdbT with pleckstrin-like domain
MTAHFSPGSTSAKQRRTGLRSAETGLAMLASSDERVCFDARRHGVVLARPLAQAVVLAVSGAVLLLFQPWPLQLPGAALIVAGALIALRAVWLWERSHLVVTTEKLFVVDGTLRRRASAVRLRSVENLELEQSLPGRLLGYGTLVAGPLEIDHVPEPRNVYRLVERLAG